METKKCTRCGNELPLESFNKSAKSKDGLQYYCKTCQSQANKESIARMKELVKDRIIVDGRTLVKKQEDSPLASFTPRQLMEELKRRGFKWDYMLEPQRKIMFDKI